MRASVFMALMAFSASAVSQDFIYYKFDSSCTTEVINLANGPQALPANGLLETTSTMSPYTTGLFGGALAASAGGTATYNRVRTGWDPSVQNVTGSLTMAWFMRLGAAPVAPFYIMGAPSGGFRLFTGGIAVTGLYQRTILAGGGNGINVTPLNDFYLPTANANIQALAAAGWVHVAMVIDSVAQTADWYVNGLSVLHLINVPGALINLAGPFTLGYYSSSSSYDLDEFVMSFRAFSATEILALSLAEHSGDGDYNSGIVSQCGAGNISLGSVGGPPAVGNLNYGVTVSSTTPSLYVLLAGLDRCTFGGVIPLPLDGTPLLPLLNGCWILSDALVTFNGVTFSPPSVMPFPIPGTVTPLSVYWQALGIDLATSASSMSRGFAVGIGY